MGLAQCLWRFILPAIATASPFQLRPAVRKEVSAIMDLVEPELVPTPARSWWDEQIILDGCFVACEQDQLVGVVAIRTRGAGHGLPERGHIAVCVVDANVQRQGCGTLLLEYANKVLSERGFECITLYVRPSNTAAIAFYSRRHFVLHERVAGYYHSCGQLPQEDGLLLVRRHTAETDQPEGQAGKKHTPSIV